MDYDTQASSACWPRNNMTITDACAALDAMTTTNNMPGKYAPDVTNDLAETDCSVSPND